MNPETWPWPFLPLLTLALICVIGVVMDLYLRIRHNLWDEPKYYLFFIFLGALFVTGAVFVWNGGS